MTYKKIWNKTVFLNTYNLSPCLAAGQSGPRISIADKDSSSRRFDILSTLIIFAAICPPHDAIKNRLSFRFISVVFARHSPS